MISKLRKEAVSLYSVVKLPEPIDLLNTYIYTNIDTSTLLTPFMILKSINLFEMHVMQGKMMRMNLFLSNSIRENPFLLPRVPLKTLFISIRSPLIIEGISKKCGLYSAAFSLLSSSSHKSLPIHP